MSALQLSPISGVPATAAGASPAGDAAATQKSAPASKTATSSQSVAAPTAAQSTAAANASAAQTAAAEDARQAARIETPSLNLSVGLVGGTFDVYVDLTDPTDNRVVARLYGPKGGAPEPPPQPAHVRTEA